MEFFSKALVWFTMCTTVIFCTSGLSGPESSINVVSNTVHTTMRQPELEHSTHSPVASSLATRQADGTLSNEHSRYFTGEKELKSFPSTRTLSLDFQEAEYWHIFLNSLYSKLSEYKIQVTRKKYTVADAKVLGNRISVIKDRAKKECDLQEYMESEADGEYVDENNVKRFLNKTIECKLAVDGGIKNIRITSSRLEELNRILNLALKDAVHVICEGQSILFKGNYITTGDIILNFLLLEKGEENESCKSFLLKKTPKVLNIFALNTFFIDVDINSTFTLKHNIEIMNVIAPKWNVIGTHKIELKGKDGELPEVSDGIDGKPGKSGGPGGNFFGIGNEFINGKKLKISVNGGDASAGQEGKNGSNGIDGVAPTTPSGIYCGDRLCDENNRINGFNCQKIECKYRVQSRYNSDVTWTVWCDYKMFGKSGTEGSDGGNGGIGGKGGYPGHIVLFQLNITSQISWLNHTGQDRASGKGGMGGIGGKRGNDIIVRCVPYYFSNDWTLVNIINVYKIANSGKNGTNGTNFIGFQLPKTASDIDFLNLTKIINQYKSYLRENLSKSFTSYSLDAFLKQLENNPDVRSVYNTLGFIDELKLLEEQFHKLNENIDFPFLYKSLLSRISEYAKKLNFGNFSQHKKVLAYLYTVILGRIHNMEDNLESDLIIDINEYVKFVKEDIKELKDIKNANNKEELINKYNEQYKHEIDIKIKEANELISEEIIPEIDNIGTDIDHQVEELINEIIYLKEQTAIEKDKLTQKQNKLQTYLALQGLLSIFKIAGQAISFLGPGGKIAGTVIGAGSTIAESFLSDDGDRYYSVMELPQSVTELDTINGRTKNISEHRIICLENTLESISLEIIKYPDILSSISLKIVSIKNKLDDMRINGYDFKEIIALEKEIDAIVQITEADSKQKRIKKLTRKKTPRDLQNKYKGKYQMRKNKNKHIQKKYGTKDQKALKKREVMGNLKRIVQMGAVISDSYNNYKHVKPKLDTINEAFKQNENNFQKLKHYEQIIYSTVMPMLQNMQMDLSDIRSKLGTKSKVALDITKWHVKSTLRNTQLLMKELTLGLKVQQNLPQCIEKLEDAMDTIMEVHNHIQDYQEKQNFASFISKISSISETDIMFANDPNLQDNLRKAIIKLEETVRSSIVVQRHKVAINALKQIVFPFADTYFRDLILPSHLELVNNKSNATLEDLVYRAINEIEKIHSKLEEYKSTVRKSDGCIGKGSFISGRIPSKPFFVWKNKQHKSMISKLLSGEAVIVKPDIKYSAPFKDAIKFNVAEFHFKLENETEQSEMDTKLKGFQLFATHLGNSYYRYENKLYKMLTASQEIWYYFDRQHNGEPFDYSLSYNKIKHGNLTLSPYASWKIYLDIVSDNSSFRDLEIYNDKVDMVLEGSGHYLNKRSKSCQNIMAEKYYTAINEIDEGYLNIQSKNQTLENTSLLPDSNHTIFKHDINGELHNEQSTNFNE